MNIVKLYQPSAGSCRITVPIDVLRMLSWKSGERVVIETDIKNKSITIKRLEDLKNV